VFDDEHLVSCAGLVPVMGLAERTGLSQLIGDRVRFETSRVASAGVNPAGKVTAIIAGMAAGADCLDDLDVLGSGGMGRLFVGVYAPATLGQHLREFTHGHTLQLASVLRAHLVGLAAATDVLPGWPSRRASTWTRLPATATPRSPASRSGARDCHRWRPRSPPGPARR
jgi:hypothetical protein